MDDKVRNLMQNPDGHELPFVVGYCEEDSAHAWAWNSDGTLAVTYPDNPELGQDWMFPDDDQLIVFGPVPEGFQRPAGLVVK